MAFASATILSDQPARAPGSGARVNDCFARLRGAGKRALVPYITAGHPTLDDSIALLQGLEDAGADIVELGLPFSDPMADGPVIQASSQRALEQGMTFDRLLEVVARARVQIPLVLFSYLNPLLAAGDDALQRAADAGLDAVLVTDLPVGSDNTLEDRFAAGPLAFIRLVAPTTPSDRMREIALRGSGFVYLISRLGVTGTREDVPADLPATLRRLRTVTTLPICVGFGIARPEQATAVARIADGVVVGSAIVRAAGESVASAVALARSLRSGVDAA
jgi:tryptophan synthase alpha chain